MEKETVALDQEKEDIRKSATKANRNPDHDRALQAQFNDASLFKKEFNALFGISFQGFPYRQK